MRDVTNSIFEIDLAITCLGPTMIGYGGQHEIVWLIAFGVAWTIGRFIQMLVKYD